MTALEIVEQIRQRITQVETEQTEAFEKHPAGFHMENEDILARFFDDVKTLVTECDPLDTSPAEHCLTILRSLDGLPMEQRQDGDRDPDDR